MDREQEVEKMVEIAHEYSKDIANTPYYKGTRTDMEAIYDVGYRKTDEVHEPKVDYKPERGGYNSWGHKECAVCGYTLASKFGCTEQEARDLSTDNYCPNCGARLKEVKE